MGFLDDGSTLTWEEAQPVLEYVKAHGVEQFIQVFLQCKDRHTPELLWGDEIEYILVRQNPEARETYLNLKGQELLAALNEKKERGVAGHEQAVWHPEYGSFMVEATPGVPYKFLGLDDVEDNMRLRRKLIEESLGVNELLMSIVNFPRLGASSEGEFIPFTYPPHQPGGPHSHSFYTPDEIINPHPRFGTLTANIRKRRGCKVNICAPLFIDNTTTPSQPTEQPPEDDGHPKRPASPTSYFLADAMEADFGNKYPCMSQVPVIHMDSMAFGMGCCCLQTTFQCPDIARARFMTDQLAVIAPYFLALTASCPIFRGLLAATDARWDVISGSVDDRTEIELGNTGDQSQKIDKSRYDSVSTFISDSPLLLDEVHNDIFLKTNPRALDRLLESGVDLRLARHVAHLFIRDPLVVYRDKIEIDDATHMDHWENIQSTNWQSVRFKPPPHGSNIGWRVEFRVMELQITEFENAALAIFSSLLMQTVHHFHLNLYIPISKVDQNMRRSQSQKAVLLHKFFVRRHILPPGDANRSFFYDDSVRPDTSDDTIPLNLPLEAYHETTIDYIVNGDKKDGFKGLIPGMWHVADKVIGVVPGSPQHARLQRYISLVSRRASGELMTAATWMRHFVTTHKEYEQNSVVTAGIAFDLMARCDDLTHGRCKEPLLLGDLV
eukprot:c10305_g1_i2.p1 GENE.c10305_g1_i2~~c10305_g1_i2.p1  ORF type:complete len:666 (+),score=149.06 c10305_g1_i2:66-2063(+)